ncbi:MAG TPA: PIN domain-containing protein [Thermoanaerobaculia bacterium]|nr:PIN domain-containing protein [Thermoanaerobaculia bacterium]
MSAEFLDTSVLIYAHDASSPRRRTIAIDLIERLSAERTGRISTQVLLEFFAAVTRKLRMRASVAAEILEDLATWTVHAPAADDALEAARLASRHSLSIRDAMIVRSALQSGCGILWSEELPHGRRFQSMVVRNPFTD